MKAELVEKVARALDPDAWREELPVPTRAAVIGFHMRRQKSAELAHAVIPVVLEEVQRHLSAVQYDPAPYTALKHRLADLANQSKSV